MRAESAVDSLAVLERGVWQRLSSLELAIVRSQSVWWSMDRSGHHRSVVGKGLAITRRFSQLLVFVYSSIGIGAWELTLGHSSIEVFAVAFV